MNGNESMHVLCIEWCTSEKEAASLVSTSQIGVKALDP